MTTAVLHRPSLHQLRSAGDRRLTLGQRLDSVWEGLRSGGASSCPVCGGPMRAAVPNGTARCGGCGSSLS